MLWKGEDEEAAMPRLFLAHHNPASIKGQDAFFFFFFFTSSVLSSEHPGKVSREDSETEWPGQHAGGTDAHGRGMKAPLPFSLQN